ncbi:MAG: hypothetical protein PHH14_00610 [Candidatus Margulisbacteria bacterium]|nr:hypothetical protein [Candidatus Margulisiibacteriota bacterium]
MNVDEIIDVIGYYGNISSKICFIAIEPGGLAMPGISTNDLYENDKTSGPRKIRFFIDKNEYNASSFKEYFKAIHNNIDFYKLIDGIDNTVKEKIENEDYEYYFKKPASYWSLASMLLREISGRKVYHGQHSFQFNVYPLPKKSTLSNIEKEYGIPVKEYHEKSLQVRPKKIAEYLSKRARDEEMLIICSGDEYKILKPFIEKDEKPISIEGIPDKMRAYKYNYYKAVVYVLPFLSRWKGISNGILKNIGQDIRNQVKNINSYF